MWLAAFSSISVSKKTVSSGPMRPPPSTSASSPRRVPPSSFAAAARSASAFSSASIFTARPPSNSTRMPSITDPYSSSGIVAVTWPSTRPGSGVVNVSSLGRFGKCSRPSTVVELGGVPQRRAEQPHGEVGPGAV